MWYLLYLADLKLLLLLVISMNPAKSSKRSKATIHNEPKISPTVRIKDFPNEFKLLFNLQQQLKEFFLYFKILSITDKTIL